MPLIWSSSSTEDSPPLLVAEVDDVLRGHRPDPLDRVELLDASRVPRLIGPSSAPRPPAASPPRRARGDDDLLAVGEQRGEVDRLDGARRVGAARPLDRVGDARAGRQPVDARLANRARDVDDDVAARPGRPRRAGPAAAALGEADLAGRRARLVGRADPARAEQQQRDADRAVDEDLRRG